MTQSVNLEDVWTEAEACLKKDEWERVVNLLRQHAEEILNQNTELSLLYYMAACEAAEQDGVLHAARDPRQAVETVRELRRRLTRLVFCGEYDAGEVLALIASGRFNARQLAWVISTVCPKEDAPYLLSRLNGGPARPEEDRAEPWTPGPDNTVSFLCCSNNRREYEEMLYYVNRLHIPPGVEVDVQEIPNAASMCAGYNQSMAACRVKYRIYLHQDVRILNRWFLYDLIRLFRRNPTVGLVGMVGAKEIDETGVMWKKPEYGNLLEARTNHIIDYLKAGLFVPYPDREGVRVSLVDGLLLATQYDVPWREDLFDGWDFYDASQSMEFRRRGYGVLVPWQQRPWCLHDSGAVQLGESYEKYRRIFVNEYLSDG